MEVDKFKKRLKRFYGVHNPSSLPFVDTICRTYQGREEDIFRVLVDKYGPEPSQEDCGVELSKKPAVKLMSLTGESLKECNDFNTHKKFYPAGVHSTSLESDGPNEARSSLASGGKDVVRSKKDLLVAPDFSDEKKDKLRKKLFEFYRIHNASMMPFVEEVIENYNGNEEKIFEDLYQRYTIKKGVQTASDDLTSADIDTVIERLSAALEVKSIETIALKKDKEQLTKDLTMFKRLLEQSRGNETFLKKQLVVVEKQVEKNDGYNFVDGQNVGITALKKENEQLTRELGLSNKLLEKLESENKLLKSQFLAINEELQKKENFAAEDGFQNAEDDGKKDLLQAEFLKARKESAHIRSSCFKLEHRIRVLELEKQQLLGEVKEAEVRYVEISDLLLKERQNTVALIKEVGALRLAVERPCDEAAFASIVKDIESRFSRHYESEMDLHKREMSEYYAYAENQLHCRDALIAELSASYEKQ